MARKLGDWIDAAQLYMEKMPAPKAYKKWAAIATVGAILERKVWTRTLDKDEGEIFPNLYVWLIGGPGVGKTQPVNAMRSLTANLEDFHIGADSVSGAGLVDELAAATCKLITPTGATTYNSLSIFSAELKILLPTYDPTMSGALLGFFDCLPEYKERKRHMGKDALVITRPQLSMLAAGTYDHLGRGLSDSVWEDGLMSRTLVIHSTQKQKPRYFEGLFKEGSDLSSTTDIVKKHNDMSADLVSDLEQMRTMLGEVRWREEPAHAYVDWAEADGPPTPEHPKLANYLTRRLVHLAKLALIASVSRSDKMIIEMQDYQRALGWLLQMEKTLPKLFTLLTYSEETQILQEFKHFVEKKWAENNWQAIPKHQCYAFLLERLPSFKVEGAIIALKAANLIQFDITGDILPSALAMHKAKAQGQA